jgi:hypothetical protein
LFSSVLLVPIRSLVHVLLPRLLFSRNFPELKLSLHPLLVIWNSPHLGLNCHESSQSQSHVTTGGLSASLSWNKAPIWGLRPDLYYCQTLAGLLKWGALSDESLPEYYLSRII